MTDQTLNLNGKVALITGAARGQGAAAVKLFHDLGATVIGTDVTDGSEVVAGLDRAEFQALDISDEDAWQRVVEYVVTTHGRLDVLLNNAAIHEPADFFAYPMSDMRRMIDINLFGPILGMRAAAAVMGEGASIINVSSNDGMRGRPGNLPYSVSKFGVRGASRSAAWDLAGKGIRVNCIMPGAIDTEMLHGATAQVNLNFIPMRRLGHANEVAPMAAFLASDLAGYITGAEISVDGGLLA
ncbi:SDR family NAD(P)-dependent oxidoreductase [Enemella sp. A6]|uniref:SDR family NAD(P)-dependent oxidoreductase n=1 Tax=Enemella sp. A6 TaxID=3440152 RepID=UPI003EBCC3CE